METTKSNVELIDNFIENERKSKTWTILIVTLFVLLAGLVLMFAYKLQRTTQKLDITRDSLRIAYALKDSLVNVWKQQANIAERTVDELNSDPKVMHDTINLVAKDKSFLLFMQCMPGFEDRTDKIAGMLNKEFKVQPRQTIKDFGFDPSVIYYRPEDSTAAVLIANKINDSD
ncbi:MAG TPA: hypothetical protein VKH37_06625, partial [Ferruginibacter sp.]|nr:hypothetical protein [Ferruginibacter sp.]